MGGLDVMGREKGMGRIGMREREGRKEGWRDHGVFQGRGRSVSGMDGDDPCILR